MLKAPTGTSVVTSRHLTWCLGPRLSGGQCGRQRDEVILGPGSSSYKAFYTRLLS